MNIEERARELISSWKKDQGQVVKWERLESEVAAFAREVAAQQGEATGVEKAITEMRTFWPRGSFRVSFSSGLPRCEIAVLREPHHSVHCPVVSGESLSEAMARVREFQEKERKQILERRRAIMPGYDEALDEWLS